jgi:hypothetical protein
MIEDWRYDDGKMLERQLALTCFIRESIEINRNTYEFCHYYVSNGLMDLPKDKDKLQELFDQTGGDLFGHLSGKLFKEYTKWNDLNEETALNKESNQTNNQTSKEAS